MQSSLRWNKLQVLALLALLFTTSLALGQGIVAGSISGTVTDATGAVVTGAKVTATSVATGLNLNAETNDTGYFTMRQVPPGAYKLRIEAKGFRPVQIASVQVEPVKDSALAAIKMEVASAGGETVEVIEAAPVLETSTAQVTNTFNTQAVADLPTGGGYDSLALFLPGIADTGSNNFSNTNGVGFSSNGLRGRSNNFQIDGQNNNDNSVAGPSIFLGNQDLLGEISIITNDFSVEYGRASGTVVNYVTKSGTNQIHGTAFEYWTGDWADSHTNEERSALFGTTDASGNFIPFCAPGQSSNCTPVARPAKYVENRPGFTVGGPIVKDKAFFFGSAFWDRIRTAGTSYTSGSNLTPTPNGLAQLAAAFPGNPAVAALTTMGPYTVKTGNPHPAGAPQTITVSDGVTSADVEFAPIGRQPPSFYNDREFSGRVDYNLTSKDRLGARYIFQQNINTVATAANNAAFAAGYWVDVPARDQQISIDWTRTFSSNLVNQARYSFSRASVPFESGSFPNCTRANILSCPTNIGFTDTFQTFGMANNLPQGRTIDTTQIQDNASWAHGRHTFKFGGEFLKQRSPNVFLPNINGSYLFADFNSFLQDNPERLSLTDGPKTLNFKERDLALYFGDDWRIKDNLTINLGLRWEYSTQAINLLHDLSVATQHGSSPFWDTTLPDSITTVPKISSPLNYFGPNVGFAWKPRFLGGGDKTVVRGGYRITYDPAFYNMFLNVATAAPNVNAGTIVPGIVPGTCNGPCLPSSGFSGNDVRALQLGNIPRGVNPGLRNYTQVAHNFHEPYVQNYSFGIQHEFTPRVVLEVRYVGNHEIGNFQTVNGNPELDGLLGANGTGTVFSNVIPAGITPCADPTQPGFSQMRVLCSNRNIRNRVNTAFSRYNGLQNQLRVASWHGLSGSGSFTWSKTMDNTSEIFSTVSGGNSVAGAQNPFNIGSGEKSLSGIDFPKTASIYVIYELPFYKGQHGFIGKLLGGYQANATWRYSSGQNYTPLTLPGDDSACQGRFDGTFYGVSTCRPFLGNPGARADTVGQCTNPGLPDCGLVDFFTGAPTTKSAVHWIYNEDNAAAFFGTPYSPVRRNPGTRGQAISTANFNMFKETKLNERVSFRVEAQVYNLFNHQFRGVPDPVIADFNLANGGSFGNNFFNNSGGDYNNVVLNGIGRRRMILGGKITF